MTNILIIWIYIFLRRRIAPLGIFDKTFSLEIYGELKEATI